MSSSTVDGAALARLRAHGHEPSTGLLVLVDHHMIPTASEIAQWVADARRRGFRTIRTSAQFPAAAASFADAGFVEVDRLALLEVDLTGRNESRGARTRPRRTRRMRQRDLAGAAEVDRRAFGDRWGNDVSALADIRRATPRHRSRIVVTDGRPVGFAISGRAGRTGYLQRLAVVPEAQRAGIGRELVADSLDWMRRSAAGRALVNTATDNQAALELYRSMGFRVRPDELTVLELGATRPGADR